MIRESLRSTLLGLFFTGLSGVCFACASLFVKLSGDVPICLIILARSVLQVVSTFTLNRCIWKQSLKPEGKILKLLLFGLLSFITIYGIYISFQRISLGEATVIISTCPIFVSLLDRTIFKTPVSYKTVAGGVTCIVGVVILCHSDSVVTGHDLQRMVGYGIVILATISQAGTFILVR